MSARQLFSISAYWFATNLHWGALLLIIVPSQVKTIAPDRKALAQSLVVGVGALGGVIVPLVVGALSDRCMSRWGRRRPYMVTGVAINVLGLLLLWHAGATRSLWLYVLGYVITNLGNNVATGAYSAVIPDLVPFRQRGGASGWMAAMTQTGTIFGALVAGMLMGAGLVSLSYLTLMGVLVGFLLITVVGTHEHPLQVRPPRLDWRQFLCNFWIDPRQYPDFAWVWITRFLVTTGMWIVQPFIQYYLTDVIGVRNPEQTAGNLLAIILVGATVTGVLGGRLSDRVGRKRVVYVANGIIAAASVGFLFGHTLAYVFVVGMIYGLAYGAYYSVDWALACDVLPSKADAAKDMAVWHISMVLPQSFSPAIGGLLLSTFGQTLSPGPDGEPVYHYTRAGYAAAFCVAALCLLLGAILLRNVKKAQ